MSFKKLPVVLGNSPYSSLDTDLLKTDFYTETEVDTFLADKRDKHNTVFVSGDNSTRTTRATAVQAAIDAATAGDLVFVPSDFLNYDASAVTFDSTIRMVREGNLSAVFDVKAYGAAGNDATTDTFAIQAAIDAAESDKGTVYFPFGTYLALSLVPKNNVRLLLSSNAVLKHKDSANAPLIENNGTSQVINFSIEGGVIDGNKANITLDTHFLVNILNFDGVQVRNCRIINSSYHALRFENGSELLISGCEFEGTNAIAALVNDSSGSVSNVVVTGNLFDSIGTIAIHTVGAENLSITGNVINETGDSAVYCLTCQHITVTGNVVHDCAKTGIKHQTGAGDCLIADNVVDLVGNSGIAVWGVDEPNATLRATVTGNAVRTTGSSGTTFAQILTEGDGIFVEFAKDVVLDGNVVTGAGRHGTLLTRFDRLVCSNNIFAESQNNGIHISGPIDNGRIVVEGNLIRNNGLDTGSVSHGIRLVGGSSFTTDTIHIIGNILYDDQGTPTQNYGIRISGPSVTNYSVIGNTALDSQHVTAGFLDGVNADERQIAHNRFQTTVVAEIHPGFTAGGPIVFPSFTDATRPAAGTAGKVIFNTDDGQLNIDDGTNWTLPDGTTT